MQDGFTFLELIVVLGIIALLALFALPQYDHFLKRHQAQSDIEQIVRMITLARQQAILRNQTVTLYPNEDWSQGLMILDEKKQMISSITFTNDANILLKTFPASAENQLQFSATGLTKTQNGSFYYCPDDMHLAKRIVFNQAGRVYVTADEVESGCE